MAQSGVVRQLADDLWLIDTQFQDECEYHRLLFDCRRAWAGAGGCGSAATLDALLAGVRVAGFDP